MAFAKGQSGNANGRPKGAVGKVPTALKDMILQALSDAGGAAYLVEQAKSSPAAFMALVGRVLPLQVKDGGADPTVPAPVTHNLHMTAKS